MLLFLDESGSDCREAPYEVLAGVAIRKQNLWPLIQAVRAAERDHFGMPLSNSEFPFFLFTKPRPTFIFDQVCLGSRGLI